MIIYIPLKDFPSDEPGVRPDARLVEMFKRRPNRELDGVVRIGYVDGRLFVRDGSRTIAALRAAGYSDDYAVPCVVTDADPMLSRLMFNNLRSRNFRHEVDAVAALVAQGYTLEEIAREAGMRVVHVRELHRIAQLPAEILDAADEGRIAWSTVRALARRPQAEIDYVVKMLRDESVKIRLADLKEIRQSAYEAGAQTLFDDWPDEIGTAQPVSAFIQNDCLHLYWGARKISVPMEEFLTWLESKKI